MEHFCSRKLQLHISFHFNDGVSEISPLSKSVIILQVSNSSVIPQMK